MKDSPLHSGQIYHIPGQHVTLNNQKISEERKALAEKLLAFIKEKAFESLKSYDLSA